MRKLKIYIENTINVAKSIKYYWKMGGYQKVEISQINHGQILKGKRIIVTGGSSGIGLAIAKKCITEGAKVVITGRNIHKLEEVKLNINNPNLNIIQWDISIISKIEIKLKQTTDLLGGDIDILINNAGVISPHSFTNVTEEVWDRIYSINSKGLFFLTQALCKIWNKNKKGIRKIINISSTSGFIGAPTPYRMSKWDVAGLTEGLGYTLSSQGILVNGIAPGRTATEMLGVISHENIYDKNIPLKRYALPEEIAELALFLMSDAANYITGQTILCDGGRTLKI